MKQSLLSRRRFVQSATALAIVVAGESAVGAAGAKSRAQPRPLPEPSPQRLPRWRGFNLLEKFVARPGGNPPFREEDFAWLAGWGFDFARLPLSYHCWAAPDDWLTLREAELRDIDAAVELGRQHGVHVNLNFHRAPGYCVNPPAEPLDLFHDDRALEAAAYHWAHFARRYRGIPNSRLSFDLLNEPKDLAPEIYFRVVQRLVTAIRGEDRDRLIIADGLRYGTKPVPQLIPLGVAQSTRGYAPTRISHYRASWMNSKGWPEPTWPLHIKEGDFWDLPRLRRENLTPWQELERAGVGVHVGEWGAYRYTPHEVTLAWMKDNLTLWREAGWGWALWNLRGDFGVLDSRRTDVRYEDFRGHSLDRAMLELLRAY